MQRSHMNVKFVDLASCKARSFRRVCQRHRSLETALNDDNYIQPTEESAWMVGKNVLAASLSLSTVLFAFILLQFVSQPTALVAKFIAR
jgi:hypothetical protein